MSRFLKKKKKKKKIFFINRKKFSGKHTLSKVKVKSALPLGRQGRAGDPERGEQGTRCRGGKAAAEAALPLPASADSSLCRPDLLIRDELSSVRASRLEPALFPWGGGSPSSAWVTSQATKGQPSGCYTDWCVSQAPVNPLPAPCFIPRKSAYPVPWATRCKCL